METGENPNLDIGSVGRSQADEPPTAAITQPPDGATVAQGGPLLIRAQAFSLEEGAITDDAAFNSDDDRDLGNGVSGAGIENTASDQIPIAPKPRQNRLRRFTVDYRLRILNEVEQSISEEEVSAILTRENLTRSQIDRWRQRKANGEFDHVRDKNIGAHHDDLIGTRRQSIKARRMDSAYPLRSGFLQPATGAETASLEELLDQIWRGKWTIFAIVLVITTATLFSLLAITPMFSAQALIIVERREQNLVGIEPVIAGLSGEAQRVESEIELLKAPALALKVIEGLHLHKIEELNPALRQSGILDRAGDVLNAWLKPFADRPEPALSKEQRAHKEMAVITGEFLNHLKVLPQGRSRVISISFESEDPYRAAQVVNKLVELYITEQLNAKLEPVARANEWLSERLSVLKEKVEAADTAVEKRRQEMGFVEGRPGTRTTIESQQISELNTQFVMARAQRAEAEARLRQVKSLVRSPAGVESVSEVLQSLLIQRLREQEAQLEREAAELAVGYGAKHPKVINMQAEQMDLQGRIAAEVTKIARALENEAGVARAREASLQSGVNALRQRLAMSNESEVKMRAVERDATAQRTLLETFLRRYNETTVQKDMAIQTADARVISEALPPTKAAYPQKARILMLSFVGSAFIGVAVVVLRDLFNKGFRSGEEIEALTGMPVLGLIPKLNRMAVFRIPPERYFSEYPSSTLGEAIRTVNTAIRFFGNGDLPKTLLITSALPTEGKTLIALSLAHTQAMAGYTVALVSADVRSPKAEAAFNLSKGPGLGEYLAGEASIDRLVKKDKATGIYVVPAGRWKATNIPESFNTKLMDKLLHDLAGEYDSVIIDSPPVMAVSEARVLATKADMTMFVVRWATTRRKVVRHALQQIAHSGKPIGIVLSIVDVRKHASYGYADSGYYHGLLEKYYNRS